MKDIFSNIGYYDILWPGLLVKKSSTGFKTAFEQSRSLDSSCFLLTLMYF